MCQGHPGDRSYALRQQAAMTTTQSKQVSNNPLRIWGSRADWYIDRDIIVLAGVCATSVLMAASMWLVGGRLGRYLLPSGGFVFFPSVVHLINPKPAEQMRYLLVVFFIFNLGALFAWSPKPRWLVTGYGRRFVVSVAAACGLSMVIGVAAWGWWAQFHYIDGEPATTHFGNGDLLVAAVIAAALMMFARLRLQWLRSYISALSRAPKWVWGGIAVLLTICWLLPSVFRAQNLASASLSVTYHLQFTFDDFAALLDGRIPLVNYTEQYASLIPFVAWPALHWGGVNVGTFTVTMCLLSLAALFSIERVFVLITRSELLGLFLYLPFLATSLFFVLRNSGELFNWASYYAVFPMRYVGPYVLLWLCVRHAGHMWPRHRVLLFAFGGLVLLNNIEFGLPALIAAVVAAIISDEPSPGWLRRIILDVVVGVLGAFAVVTVMTVAVAGSLPSLGSLTMYSRIFGEGGYGLLHTPLAGLHMIVFMTFGAAILVGALRYRDRAENAPLTVALAFSGVFGLGAGEYYTGRTHPAGLVVLFSIWALAVLLLGVLALRSVRAWNGRPRIASMLFTTGALLMVGLTATSLTQFPAPWVQVSRIERSSALPAPYNVSAAVDFVRRTAKRSEPIILLTPLGHVIALDADVENVSPYSSPEGVVTYEQLDETFAALRAAHGTRFYVSTSVFPEITGALAREGVIVARDGNSGTVEWQLRR
jgi:hypothetical protein